MIQQAIHHGLDVSIQRDTSNLMYRQGSDELARAVVGCHVSRQRRKRAERPRNYVAQNQAAAAAAAAAAEDDALA